MVQRRKALTSAASSSLALPFADSSISTMGKRSKGYDGYSFLIPKFWSVMVLIGMSALLVLCIRAFTTSSVPTPSPKSQRVLKPLPLAQFPTLNKAFEQSELVGLYFAASWCSMSTSSTKLLGDIFSDLLVRDPSKFALVYVSSDKDAESMDSYMKPGWIAVPFDSSERTALKKHFSVCAQREMEALDMERKYEIPSLFLFDRTTRGLISTHGVKDLKNYPSLEVYELWKGTQRIVQELVAKYGEETAA